MDEAGWKSIEYFLNEVIDRWLKEDFEEKIRKEASVLGLEEEEEIKILIIEKEMALKSLLIKWGYIDTEIDALLAMSIEEIQSIEDQGGFESWRRQRRSSQKL